MLKRLMSLILVFTMLSTTITNANIGNGNFSDLGKINYNGDGGTHTEGVSIFISKRVQDDDYPKSGEWNHETLDLKTPPLKMYENLVEYHRHDAFIPHMSEPIFVFDVKPGEDSIRTPNGGRFISGLQVNDEEWYKLESGILTRNMSDKWELVQSKKLLSQLKAKKGNNFSAEDLRNFINNLKPHYLDNISDLRFNKIENTRAMLVSLSKGINQYTNLLNSKAKLLDPRSGTDYELSALLGYLAFIETSMAVLANVRWEKMLQDSSSIAAILCDIQGMKENPISIVVEPALFGSVNYVGRGRHYAPVMVQDLWRLGTNLNPYNHINGINNRKPFSWWSNKELGHLASMAQNVFNNVTGTVATRTRAQVNRGTPSGTSWTYGYLFPTMLRGVKEQGYATHNLSAMDITTSKLFPSNNPILVSEDHVGRDIYVGIDIVPDGKIWKELKEQADPNHIYIKVDLTREAVASAATTNKPYTPSKSGKSNVLSYRAPTNDEYSDLFSATSLQKPIKLANPGGLSFAVEMQGDWIKIPLNKTTEVFSKGSYWERDLLKFIDKTSKISIADNEKLTYTYKSKVTLSYLKKGKTFNPANLGNKSSQDFETKYVGPNSSSTGPEEKSVTVSFVRGDKPSTPPSPEEWSWYSKPDFSAYSEIKHNLPRQEQFEAMSGVPTGERMYYAIGGVPYVVEAEFKYHTKKQATREYHSYFTPVNSLYFDSDKAISVQVKKPSPGASGSLSGSISNAHKGGTWTVTWTGDIPNKGKDGPTVKATNGTTVSSTATNNYDFSKFDAALAALNKFAGDVVSINTSTSFTAPSDGKTRYIVSNDWNISKSDSRPSAPSAETKTSTGTDEVQADENGQGYKPATPGPSVQAKKSPDLKFTISVTATLKPKSIDGPESEHILPQVNDRWKSTVEFDYIEIKNARVWRLDSGTVSGGEVNTVFGSPVKATIKKEHMLEYINISSENNAETSRLRYTANDYTAGQPNYTKFVKASPWLDKVVWNEGPRSNVPSGTVAEQGTSDQQNGRSSYATSSWLKQAPIEQGYPNARGIAYNNNQGSFANRATFNGASALDKATKEWKKFEQRRNTKITPTLISDFIVLHTDEGDIPIFYFEKTGLPKNADEESYGYLNSSKEEQWDNNKFGSIATRFEEGKWSPGEVGYNGNFEEPSQKFSALREDREFDYSILHKDKDSGEEANKSPKTIKKYERPKQSVNSTSDSIVTRLVPNGEYILLDSRVNWKFLDIKDTSNNSRNNSKVITILESVDIQEVGRYSNGHEDVNNIVIHDPSSTKYAMIESLPNELDQRTAGSKAIKFFNNPKYKQTITRLKANRPPQELLYNVSGSIKTVGDNKFPESWSLVSGTAVGTTNGINLAGEIYQRLSIDAALPLIASISPSGHTKWISFHDADGTEVSGRLNITTQTTNVILPDNVAYIEYHVKGNGKVPASSLKFEQQQENWIPVTYTTEYTIKKLNPNYVDPSTLTQVTPNQEVFSKEGDGTTGMFLVVDSDGTYEITLSGAQGGGNPDNKNSSGSLGNRIRFTLELKKGVQYELRLGTRGKHSPHSSIDRYDGVNSNAGLYGGNGVGSAGPGGGGYAAILINGIWYVAGGGGGNFNSTTPIGYGDGSSNSTGQPINGKTPSTSRSNSNYPNDTGGSGGGWEAGLVEERDDNKHAYNGTNKSNGNTEENGVSSGNARISVVAKSIKIKLSPEQLDKEIIDSHSSFFTVDAAPDSWYETVEIEIDTNAPISNNDGTFTPGNFILLDNTFTVYYPNKGDFSDKPNLHGIPEVTLEKGKGWRNNMDTSRWVKSKQVRFAFPVIYDGVMYLAREWIDLSSPKTTERYQFYIPLAADEARSAEVEFRTFTENDPSNIQNPDIQNFVRNYDESDYAAYHSSFKRAFIDVVGRIGNSAIADTGDFRFANMFKRESNRPGWIIQNIMPNVDYNRQKFVVGDTVDIRGLNFTEQPFYGRFDTTIKPRLNTYQGVWHKEVPVKPYPLISAYSEVSSLKAQPMRIGYKTYQDIETIGNYDRGQLQIVPKYFMANVTTGEIIPVDVWMKGSNGFQLINRHNNAYNPTTDKFATEVHNYVADLNWIKEHVRRGFLESPTEYPAGARTTPPYDLEALHTKEMIPLNYAVPSGNYHYYGNAQLMNLNEKNRTFVGDTHTYGFNKNPGNKLGKDDYVSHGQRWHFSLGLPSSAVFSKSIEYTKNPDQSKFDWYKTGAWVLLTGIDQIAVGHVYSLKADTNNPSNVPITLRDKKGNVVIKPIDLSRITTAKIVIVSNPNKSSADDIDTHGTH